MSRGGHGVCPLVDTGCVHKEEQENHREDQCQSFQKTGPGRGMGQNIESDIRTALHTARLQVKQAQSQVKQLEYALAKLTEETPKPRTPTQLPKDHVWTAEEHDRRGNVKELRKLAEAKALEVKHAARQCERCGRYNYDWLTVCCGA